MRNLLCTLACILFVLTPALAEDGGETKGAPARLSPAVVADQVLQSLGPNHVAALARLAARKDPDRWLVADVLCQRGEQQAAIAFADAAPPPAAQGLRAYVRTQTHVAPNPKLALALIRSEQALMRGDHAGALSALSDTGPMGSPMQGIQRDFLLGAARQLATRRKEGIPLLESAASAARKLKWHIFEANVHRELALAAYQARDFKAAIRAWTNGLVPLRALAHEGGIAATLGNIGFAQFQSGDSSAALKSLAASMDVLQKSKDFPTLLGKLGTVAQIRWARGEYELALDANKRSIAVAREHKLRVQLGSELSNLGARQFQLSRLEAASKTLLQAVAELESLGDKPALQGAVGNLGILRYKQGAYGDALTLQERALALAREFKDVRSQAKALGNIGLVHASLGRYEIALRNHAESARLGESVGNEAGVAASLNNMGLAHALAGRGELALALYQQSLRKKEALKDVRGVARTLNNIGQLQITLKRYDAARATLKRAAEMKSVLGDAVSTATTLGGSARLELALGRSEEAIAGYKAVLELLDKAPNPPAGIDAVRGLVYAHFRLGQWEEAMTRAREATTLAQTMTRGLGDVSGATAGDQWSDVYNLGALAALRSADHEAAALFLERGRATSLRVALGARTALEAALIPAALARERSLLASAEARAMAALRQATRRRDRERTRAARKAYEGVRAAALEVVGRIQREAKRGAAIAYPEADSLEVIRARLAANEVLVLYGLTKSEGLALVVHQTGTKLVSLGPRSTLDEAMEDLKAADQSAKTAASVRRLRKLLIDPLELDARIQHLLICPDGRLAYVPIALLIPDKVVTFTPSGTTHGVLLGDKALRGQDVLALGNADYSGQGNHAAQAAHRSSAPTRLVPLPKTEFEAKAVGDVTLLGSEASEAGFRQAVSVRKRWRSVHMACHGLVDPERPLLCSLALTPDGENDGFLTAREIYGLKIMADLVVLSACETGRGRIFKTEGIVGLTRAFMFAGSPRVICSLWKVDDEATQALMTKFYELWNPKAEARSRQGRKGKPARPRLGAAAALREAQRFVRSHQKWKHPYYWAAWVLWGLPQ